MSRTVLPESMKFSVHQREMLVRISLVFFCIGLWFSVLYIFMIFCLILAWILDDRATTFKQLIKEPLVQAILLLCAVILLGLFWSEMLLEGRHKWTKYFLLLLYLPFLALLNKQRLPWVIAALLAGYCLVLFTGVYTWVADKQQGIPDFNMTYLTFSAMLGIGCILLCCYTCVCQNKFVRISFAVLALTLLYLQFHQSARGFLLATLLTLLIIIIVHFRITLRTLAVAIITLSLASLLFAYTSPVIQERWDQAEIDFEKMQQGNYSTSIGYRIALWDVGLHGIVEKPLLGHGTAMPESYFDRTIMTYKNGVYKDLPDFQRTSHYHNDWIEIGMHTGALGILCLTYLLWAWFMTFKQCQLTLLGTAMVSFIFFSGLTETFIIFGRIPVLLLVITAIIICWQKENSVAYRYNNALKSTQGTSG